MNLTPEEEFLLTRFVREKGRRGFYVAVLSPIALFGAYGFVTQDFIALTIALLGALAFLTWHVSASSSSAALLKSIAEKVLAAKDETNR
jgi:hypothetical protein